MRIIGAQPSEGSRIPGIRKWPEAYLPKIYDPTFIDEMVYVSQDDAEEMARRLAREEGLFAGISAAGACWVALQIAKTVENATIVFVVCDRGDRYLSTGVFPGMSHSFNYCPNCATELQMLAKMEDGGEKARLRCAACGWTHWNNPTPVLAAVIELADRDGQVLLARNAAWTGRMFALITGFMEAGETPEEGIAREVKEETKLTVDSLKLIGVYDFQRMNQVIIAYHAVARGEIVLSPELAEYRLYAPKTSSAGAPAPATRWPTGCARAASSRSGWTAAAPDVER